MFVWGWGWRGWWGKEGSLADRETQALPDLLRAGQRRKLLGHGAGNLRRTGIPAAATVPLRLSQPPRCWRRAFSSGWGREGFGGGLGREWNWQWVPPYSTNLPPLSKSRRAPGTDSQSGPRPPAPFPLFPRISGGGPGSARGRTFFAKKGKDAAARAAGTSGSDSRHEWVTAPPPPPRDSGAEAGMSEGGCPPKWGDGAERCSPLPASDSRCPCPALGPRQSEAHRCVLAGRAAWGAPDPARCLLGRGSAPRCGWTQASPGGGPWRPLGEGPYGPADPRDHLYLTLNPPRNLMGRAFFHFTEVETPLVSSPKSPR